MPGRTGIHICNECVKVCTAVIAQEEQKHLDVNTNENVDINIDHLPTPSDIKGVLDDYVIEQDQAKIVVAVAVYNHYKRFI